MTRMLEVRLFWDDVLLAAESFALTPQLRVEASSEPGAAFPLPEALCPAPIVIADARHVHDRVELGALTFVTELHEEERSPRPAWDASAALATLLALAFHSSLLAFGGSSPRTSRLALDDGPTNLLARYALEAPRRARSQGGTTSGPTPEPRASAARSTRRRGARREALGDARASDVVLGELARTLPFSTHANGTREGTNLAWLDEATTRAGRLRISCGLGAPCATPMSEDRTFGFSEHLGRTTFHGRYDDVPDAHLPTCRTGGRCGTLLWCRGCSEEVRGSLSPDMVRRVMRSRRGGFTGCYERELIARPAREGRVETSFVVTASGQVRSVRATSDELPRTAACVAWLVARMTFPQSEGVTDVTSAFAFSPVAD